MRRNESHQGPANSSNAVSNQTNANIRTRSSGPPPFSPQVLPTWDLLWSQQLPPGPLSQNCDRRFFDSPSISLPFYSRSILCSVDAVLSEVESLLAFLPLSNPEVNGCFTPKPLHLPAYSARQSEPAFPHTLSFFYLQRREAFSFIPPAFKKRDPPLT